MAAKTGYVDIGAFQHKDGGGDAAKTGYVDIGALQHEDAEGDEKPWIYAHRRSSRVIGVCA